MHTYAWHFRKWNFSLAFKFPNTSFLYNSCTKQRGVKNKQNLCITNCQWPKSATVLKRIQFASRGNVDRHDKRTSHIKVVVTDNKVMEGENA